MTPGTAARVIAAVVLPATLITGPKVGIREAPAPLELGALEGAVTGAVAGALSSEPGGGGMGPNFPLTK